MPKWIPIFFNLSPVYFLPKPFLSRLYFYEDDFGFFNLFDYVIMFVKNEDLAPFPSFRSDTAFQKMARLCPVHLRRFVRRFF